MNFRIFMLRFTNIYYVYCIYYIIILLYLKIVIKHRKSFVIFDFCVFSYTSEKTVAVYITMINLNMKRTYNSDQQCTFKCYQANVTKAAYNYKKRYNDSNKLAKRELSGSHEQIEVTNTRD